jgi:parallel beta-helix repeat protein
MSKLKSLSLLIVLVFLALSSLISTLPVKADSRTIIVPDNFSSIQAAIVDANSGDTVLVRNGVYAGGIVIDKAISLKGEDTRNTIINGGVVMAGITMKTSSGSINDVSSKAENQLVLNNLASKPNFYETNFIPPKTTVMLIISSDVTISGLTVKGGDNGIVAYGDRIKVTSTKSGIHVIGSYGTFTDNTGGVNCGGSFNLITRNNVTAIKIDGSTNTVSDNYVSGNIASGGGWLVQVNGNSNTIADNTVINGQIGIHIENGSDNLVTENCVEGNYFMGIHVFNGNNNRFIDNYVAFNLGPWDGWGISLSGNNYHAENNIFFGNTITNNSHNVRVESQIYRNFWDNGQEGNYWGDYNGTDNNGGNIGDLSYAINSNNIDHYPRMIPKEITIPIAQGPFYTPPGTPQSSPNPSPTSNTPTPPAPTLHTDSSPTPTSTKSGNETKTLTETGFQSIQIVVAAAVPGALVVVGLLVYLKRHYRGQNR